MYFICMSAGPEIQFSNLLNLQCLAADTNLLRRLLGCVAYVKNVMLLHGDKRLGLHSLWVGMCLNLG